MDLKSRFEEVTKVSCSPFALRRRRPCSRSIDGFWDVWSQDPMLTACACSAIYASPSCPGSTRVSSVLRPPFSVPLLPSSSPAFEYPPSPRSISTTSQDQNRPHPSSRSRSRTPQQSSARERRLPPNARAFPPLAPLPRLRPRSIENAYPSTSSST
jgi:hypothetical protein